MSKSIWRNVSVDIETYSDVDIAKAGLYKYAQSPAFEVLLIAWAVDDGPVQIADLTADPTTNDGNLEWQKLAEFVELWRADDVLWHAYNAAFEHYCLNTWAARNGLPLLAIGDWFCTMAHGLYCGYPAGLAAIGEAMGLPQDKKKMGVGAALIRRFCVPQREKALPLLDGLDGRSGDRPYGGETTLAKVRRWIQAEPEKWKLFKEYCAQDVVTEREIKKRLMKWPMPAREQILWELTTEANMSGVGVDLELVDAAIAIGEAEQEKMMQEAREISGLDNPKSVQQLMKWLNKALDTDGETEITDLRKATVSDLLEKLRVGDKAAPERPNEGRAEPASAGAQRQDAGETRGQGSAASCAGRGAEKMLELRQQMSKTSTKKYDALQAATCDDGRVRGMMFYYGANRSGRWAGRIVQPQNLPQNHLPCLDMARELVKARDAEMVKVCYGSVPDTLSQLIRTAFIPRPGKLYAVADYSAIEARVVAWLAGETWVLEAFQAGKDIYCATASQMFGVPVEKHGVNGELRQRGKVATLALGYGGGESALIAMGALKMGIPEEDLPEIKAKWRQANPAICRLWKKVEAAALATVATGATTQAAGCTFRFEADTATNQYFMTIELPARTVLTPPADDGLRAAQPVCAPFGPSGAGAGRKLFYAQPTLLPAKNFPDRKSLHYMSVNQTSKKWAQTDTWGGKLVENITQAVARDCLAETLIRLRHRQMIAVFHVHDETIVEVYDPNDLDTILSIMAEPIDWAPGLPLKGAGFVCDYYQKD